MKILVLNCGSSSLKFAVYTNNRLSATGVAERLNSPCGNLSAKADDNSFKTTFSPGGHLQALEAIIDFLKSANMLTQPIDAIGHRVVHGAEKFSGSVFITEQVKQAILECSPLAPLHNPANLLGIEQSEKVFPGIPQVAVFDTAFHQSLPEHTYLYPIPYKFYTKHKVRRYGFHGTSHRFVSQKTADLLQKPSSELCLLIAHLGNGCSATAVKNGLSVDTTMGLTPMEGLVMGTRSGTIDPGLFSFFNTVENMSIEQIDTMLNKESGLLGLSEQSNDMRTLMQAMDEGDKAAKRAIDVFCFRLAQHLGQLAVSLPRIDALVFTGGIGENNAGIREWTCAHLEIFGFKLHNPFNAEHGKSNKGIISASNSPLVMVVPTDEELLIALDCEQVLQSHSMESE